MIGLSRAACALVALLCAALPSFAAVTVTVGTADTQVLIGKIITPEEVILPRLR